MDSIFYPHNHDIPYGITVPKKVENLLVGSGKSVPCEPPGLLRGMSMCMMLGQASGCAAAIAAKQGVTPRSLDIRTLQRMLLEQGVYLGPDDRLKAMGLK